MDGGTEVYGTLVSDIQTDVSVTGKPVYLTASGNDITVDIKKGNMIEPVISMLPIQDLNGYDKAWYGGAERNILNPLQMSEGYLTNTGTVQEQTNAKEYYSADFIDIGTASNISVGYFGYSEDEEPWIAICWYNSEKEFIRRNVNGANVYTWNIPENATYFRVTMSTFNHDIKYSYSSKNNNRDFIPYANVCPIVGRTKVDISVNGSVITREYGQEIFGGTDEIVEGVLIEEYGIYTFTGNEVWQKQQTTEKYFTTAYILHDIAELPEDNSHSVKIITSIGTFNEPYNVLQYRHYTICIAADGRIGISADLKEEQDTLKGVQICYKLKREREILTTKGYVPLDKGTNEITVSNNDIITFDYCSTLAGKISGTLSYIEDGLAPSGYLSGSGNFLALHLDSEDWDIYTSVKVGLYPSEGSGMVEILTDEEKICVGKITSNDQVFMVESTDGTLTKTDVYSLSDLVLETE